MAKRDILKEAIADAKAVKETAIANAKAALEEAFTPQLKSMLAAKLEEMELEEENETIEEMGSKNREDNSEEKKTNEEMKEEKSMEEKTEVEEELNLDEILAEIETELNEEETVTEEEVSEETVNEETVEETEITEENIEEETVTEDESEEEEAEEEAEETEDEEINLEDMTDEDLKGFIEDVIADMVASGDLEAGDNFEEDTEEEVGMEVMDSEEEVEITESTEEVNEEDIDEVNTTGVPGTYKAGNKWDEEGAIANALKDAGVSLAALGKKGLDALKKWSEDFEKNKKYASSGNKVATRPGKGFLGLEEELKEAHSTIETLKSELNEVNLLNAKLLYTNKIFKAKSLTESEKVKVLGAFDKAATIKETKLVFETLNEGLKTKKNTIRESLGSASKATGNFKKTKNPIVETDPMVERFKKLAGLK
tara:strand:- start:649 stop:1926 length:1278 start_codon:yes stop_codon:yes gene_type:complete